MSLLLAAGITALKLAPAVAAAAEPAPGDFWIRDDAGRITHTWTDKEQVVMCLQGRRTVLQIQPGAGAGLEYSVRFLNVQPDNFKRVLVKVGGDISPQVTINGQPLKLGVPSAAAFDGLLTCRYPAVEGVVASRTVYPSTSKALILEEWQLINTTAQPVTVTVAKATRPMNTRNDTIVSAWHCAGVEATQLNPGGALSFTAWLEAKGISDPDLAFDAFAERRARQAWAEAAWHGPGRLETPEPAIDLAFTLQKFHVLECPAETFQGVITHNGSLTYAPGVWANDPVEYSSPVFPFFGSPELNEAGLNMYRLWQVYCQKNGIHPFPGSFEHEDLKLVQRDRGDDAMVLYGLSKFLLFLGDRKAAESLWPLIELSAESVRRHTTADGIIASRTDEMEGRYPTGNIGNLSTAALAYGGYRQAARLAHSLGKAEAAEFDRRADALNQAIESYFGAEVEGVNTYRYYQGNTTLRGWILLPLAMGLTNRQAATVGALVSDKLWPNRMAGANIRAESIRSSEWGRETYYALRVLFKAGDTEEALELTRRVVQAQVFGPAGPYPDEDAIDMLCPGSLYPRIFIEGTFGIVPTGLNSFECTPWLPKDWPRMALRDMRAFGGAWDLVVERAGDQQKITVTSQGKTIFTDTGPAGKTSSVTVPPLRRQ